MSTCKVHVKTWVGGSHAHNTPTMYHDRWTDSAKLAIYSAVGGGGGLYPKFTTPTNLTKQAILV